MNNTAGKSLRNVDLVGGGNGVSDMVLYPNMGRCVK